MTDIMESVRQQLMAFPSSEKEVTDLADAERIALCIASSCTMDYRAENTEGGYRMVASTVNPVGIVKINGRFKVYERRSAADESAKEPK